MLYVGGARLLHIVALGGVALPGLAYVVVMGRTGSPACCVPRYTKDLQGMGSSSGRSSAGSGGVGRRARPERAKMFRLRAHTDFIFSVAKSSGWSVPGCRGALHRGGERGAPDRGAPPDPFASLLAFGTTVLIVLKGLNVGVVLGCLLPKGSRTVHLVRRWP
jgi:cell division protein FtsW (lipid II flippase)